MADRCRHEAWEESRPATPTSTVSRTCADCRAYLGNGFAPDPSCFAPTRTVRVIDTHAPADGSPTAEGGGGERRPCAKWDNFAPGLHALDIIGEWGAMVEEPPHGHDSAGTRYGVGGKCLGTVPGRDAVAAKIAAEDAAARLLVDALLDLGPAAEGLLREAMGRVGK